MGGQGSGPQKGGGSGEKQTSFQKRHAAQTAQLASAQATINKALGVSSEARAQEQTARESFRRSQSSSTTNKKPSVSRKDVGSKHDIGNAKFIKKKGGLATFRGDLGIK